MSEKPWRFFYMGYVSVNYVTDLLERGVRASCRDCDWTWHSPDASMREGHDKLGEHWNATHNPEAPA